ncbi:endoplasmic reticulum-Golgi intermediate compartment protein 2 [Nasonia vitripennis]|uniref:Endoplasmic reticulum-Golgi intermediate compartment protein 2 n=1 Tax=Nasonia vitripennis TaxID=7425 RepID=A0A7M7QUE1_NASVI|nr:endoplasmic reticulum-Golgi intermediate compartment protein 2 [Nasonia vitripennis]XP_016845138.1 endoplasmic reticulum-Golgi intermediate compartment protein 2 [Nasonia vitripennis]XP_032453788.1 endoplasmic reticulum-Golgi intermediate compartment protein 2 [Nasonia vitripennis]XP_032453789.1 endoplasmic reticulum-Golgi intermediate compartment protein 2 [Nasonia vitripennis]XP_032453790.1 endoplasmic reticulum-Golgi intermediate compartment protein 2 [Nasonia vitripennis]
MLRKRNIIKVVKELDAFTKIPEDYRKQSAVGGTFSLASFCIIVYLIYAETSYFLDSRLQFKFEPDVEYDSQLQMNIDITVATPCDRIGADILDSTNQNLMTSENFHLEDTWWDLTPDQRAHFEALKHMNYYFREEYHALHELLWKSNQLTFSNEMPKRDYIPSYPSNACRIYGSLDVNKVAGNFHVTSGKSVILPRGHFHFTSFHSSTAYNFTHRINRFSFGKPSPGIIHPLEGDEKITTDNMMLFQYFIEVVSTDINMLMHKSKTYQYSVKDHQRPINHAKGSHGIPGIFFKYDTSALKIKVSQERDSIGQFLVKLCATVGCIFVTNGILNSIVQNFWCLFCYKFLQNSNGKSDEKVTVDSKGKVIGNPINLINVMAPPSIDDVDLLSKP